MTQLFMYFSPAYFSTSIAQPLSVVNEIFQRMSSFVSTLPKQNSHRTISQIKKIPDPSMAYTCPRTLLPLLTPLMPLSAILVLPLIFILLSPTTSPSSPAPASCTPLIFGVSDPCLTLKLPPPSPP